MEKKIIKNHTKGSKSIGRTNWSKVLMDANSPKIDEENPELVGKKQFKKGQKS